jgi:3-deoxy-D-manno-octulosonate 8-phosphate phosphatase (KDO 8-P phosphatase)
MLTTDQLSTIRLIAFDFDGVFTDNTVYVSQDGVESVRCWRSDGLGLSRLRSVGVQVVIISTEINPVVSIRAKKLKLPFEQGVEDKAEAILSTCTQLNISPKETMFVGNDVNDIPAFKSVTFPVAVADAHPEIYPFVLYRTQKPGGMGAVREICDLVYNARNTVTHENKSCVLIT